MRLAKVLSEAGFNACHSHFRQSLGDVGPLTHEMNFNALNIAIDVIKPAE